MALVNIVTKIELDVYDFNLTPSLVKTIALDSGIRTIEAVIREKGQLYDIGQDATVVLTVMRPDKTGVQITGETCAFVNRSGDDQGVTVYGTKVDLTQAALAIKGKLPAQFKITSGDRTVRTEIFTIENGQALDADITDWVEYQGYNLDEMTQSIEDLSSDVSEIQEDVSDLKEGLNDITEGGSNLFTGEITHFGFDAGKLVEGEQYRSFYFSVSNGDVYTVSRKSTAVFNRFRYAFMTEVPEAAGLIYNYRGSQASPATSGDSLTVQIITVPSNHEYKFCVLYLSNASETIDESSELMINTGDTALPYEPYSAITAIDIKARGLAESADNTVIRLQQMNRANRWPSSALDTPPLVLLHFSDIHNDTVNMGRIADFASKYNAYLDDIIHTGDLVQVNYTEGIKLFDSIPSALQVIGNHDTKIGSNYKAVTESDAYANYFAPYVSNWNATVTTGKCYYYKDYATKNVRLIVLDCMHESSDQLAWFQNTLSDALANNLTVVCATHIAYQGLTSLDCQFDSQVLTKYWDTHRSSNYDLVGDDYPTAVDTFISNGGKFACWLTGHAHFGIFAKLTAHQSQIVVDTPNAGIAYAQSSEADRVVGTKSQDCYNIVAIDAYSSLVKIMRVGCDYTRWGKHPDMVCWDFANKEFLS